MYTHIGTECVEERKVQPQKSRGVSLHRSVCSGTPYSGHLEMRTSHIERTHLAVSLRPLKSGHLTNQDTFFCPKAVQIREISTIHTCTCTHVTVYISPSTSSVSLSKLNLSLTACLSSTMIEVLVWLVIVRVSGEEVPSGISPYCRLAQSTLTCDA